MYVLGKEDWALGYVSPTVMSMAETLPASLHHRAGRFGDDHAVGSREREIAGCSGNKGEEAYGFDEAVH